MSETIRVRVNSYGPGRSWMLVYTDPLSGKKVAKTSGIPNTGKRSQKEADRKAAVWEADLNAGRYKSPSKVTWQEFRETYEREHLDALSPRTFDSTSSALNHIERLLNPDRLAKLSTPVMSRFIANLREEGMKDSTLASHLRGIKAGLRWAVVMGLMAECPKISMPKSGGSRGRPITLREFQRMVAHVPEVRPEDSDAWVRYLTGLWLSGLRLEESLVFSWDPDALFAVDLSGKRPRFRIDGRAQKSGRTEVLPMTPDFAEWLLQTPPEDREGAVFAIPSLLDGFALSPHRVGKIVTKIGEKARVLVNPETGKTASAHDLRRSFGSRWAKKVMPATLQKLMRHTNIQTTMKYYVDIDCDELAEELWSGYSPQNGNTGATLGPVGPNGSEEEEPQTLPVSRLPECPQDDSDL